MPLTIQPISRRGFCRTVLGGVAAAAFSGIPRNARAEDTGRDHWVFLSDTHIPDDPGKNWWGTEYNPCKNFADACEAVLKLAHKPKGVIVTGDLTYVYGTPEDYRVAVKQVAPYIENGIPVHVCLGNHDRLGNFHAAFPDMKNAAPPVADKHIAVLETPNANLFLLDSLYQDGSVSGFLGVEQLRWLKKALDARKDKPALLFAHHNLDNAEGTLMDREEFWSVVKRASQVKAYIYGHTHVYRQGVRDNVHLINIQALGWVDGAEEPVGWSDVEISGKGIQLTLHTVPASNPSKDGDVRTFEWMR